MNTADNEIVRRALEARTEEQAAAVQSLIEDRIGARYERAVGDKGNNQGLMTQSGASYDHKALEPVTNMQDTVLERFARAQFGSIGDVPFASPHEAATTLLAALDRKAQAELATVTIDSAGAGQDKKRVSITLRDHGCGITPADVPRTIFQLGAGQKNGVDWLQGTFGVGGATTYRNAKAVILVTRRRPEFLAAGEPDVITIAVVQWGRKLTTTNATYLVTKPWDESDPGTWANARPLCIAADEYPEFDPGTHMCLVGYESTSLARRSGDEKSFDTVLSTRLYRPVMPTGYRNNITRPERLEILEGLERRLDDNPGPAGTEGKDSLPFRFGDHTYKLPIRFRIFAKGGEKGERRNYVAHGHALMITSNGQVHRHWSPQEFKLNTRLNKLANRILVVVEVDSLPITMRSQLFTADRAQFVQSSEAVHLEKEITAFLNDWPALQDANNDLIREQIAGDRSGRPTLAVAQKIARAADARGFSMTGSGGGTGGGGKRPRRRNEEELHENPTHFEGPQAVTAKTDSIKPVYYKLNAKNGFFHDRGTALHVTCTHPDIGDDEITVGDLDGGVIRVSVSIPENADLGEYRLEATIPEWTRSSGGLGPVFTWSTDLTIVDEITPKPSGGSSGGTKKGTHGAGAGPLVALIWRSHEDDGVDDWRANTVGEVDWISGKDLAAQKDEYKELAKIAAPIPTIVLNRTYSPLKGYLAARAKELTDEGTDAAMDRYAVGAGVAVLLNEEKQAKAKKAGTPLDDETVATTLDTAARAVLSVLPEADRILREMNE